MPYKQDVPEYYLARLNDRQKNVALLLIQGLSNKAIAERFGITEISVSNYKKSSIFQAYWRSVRTRVEDSVVHNERMVADLIPKVLELSHNLVGKALDGEMLDKDAISLSKHWTKPYVDLPGEGSILSPEELKELQKRAQAPFFNKSQAVDVEIIPYQGEALPSQGENLDDENDLSSSEDLRPTNPDEGSDDILLEFSEKAPSARISDIFFES